ncbi:MAG: Cell wall assembly/cell proliferation coordinating protein [Gemmatimonadetes bacterium]|nr:Cell wall assembly/cell proliferation coordinating protein [Gemmatimonadota bacterium]
MTELLSALGAYWRSKGAEPAGGASPAEIAAFERDRGVRLPADVRDYFATLNGIQDASWDDEFIAFWPLHRVRSVAAELGHQEAVPARAAEFFCFADYSIWCNAYAVRLSTDGAAPTEVVAVYSGHDLVPAASSLSAFLRHYLNDDRLNVLHPPWEKDGKHYGAAS